LGKRLGSVVFLCQSEKLPDPPCSKYTVGYDLLLPEYPDGLTTAALSDLFMALLKTSIVSTCEKRVFWKISKIQIVKEIFLIMIISRFFEKYLRGTKNQKHFT
jgi:hypothetical protein